MIRDIGVDREVGDTLEHQILENFDLAIRSRGMPGGWVQIRRIQMAINRDSHIGVYVNGSGAFGDKAKDKGCQKCTYGEAAKSSQPCCSINSFTTGKGQIDRSIWKYEGTETSLDSVQIAVSCGDPDVFWMAGHLGER